MSDRIDTLRQFDRRHPHPVLETLGGDAADRGEVLEFIEGGIALVGAEDGGADGGDGIGFGVGEFAVAVGVVGGDQGGFQFRIGEGDVARGGHVLEIQTLVDVGDRAEDAALDGQFLIDPSGGFLSLGMEDEIETLGIGLGNDHGIVCDAGGKGLSIRGEDFQVGLGCFDGLDDGDVLFESHGHPAGRGFTSACVDGDLVDAGRVHHELDAAADIVEIQVEILPAGDGYEILPLESAVLCRLEGGDVDRDVVSLALVELAVRVNRPEIIAGSILETVQGSVELDRGGRFRIGGNEAGGFVAQQDADLLVRIPQDGTVALEDGPGVGIGILVGRVENDVGLVLPGRVGARCIVLALAGKEDGEKGGNEIDISLVHDDTSLSINTKLPFRFLRARRRRCSKP